MYVFVCTYVQICVMCACYRVRIYVRMVCVYVCVCMDSRTYVCVCVWCRSRTPCQVSIFTGFLSVGRRLKFVVEKFLLRWGDLVSRGTLTLSPSPEGPSSCTVLTSPTSRPWTVHHVHSPRTRVGHVFVEGGRRHVPGRPSSVHLLPPSFL